MAGFSYWQIRTFLEVLLHSMGARRAVLWHLDYGRNPIDDARAAVEDARIAKKQAKIAPG